MAGDLPSVVDTDGPVGAAVLIMAARGSLDASRLGDDLAELVTHGALKAGRVTESLSSAAQAGAHLTVGAVLAAALPALLPEPGAKPPAGLAELLTLIAECAETTRQLPPVEGIAELATHRGSSLYLKAARRLHTPRLTRVDGSRTRVGSERELDRVRSTRRQSGDDVASVTRTHAPGRTLSSLEQWGTQGIGRGR
ncbi:hypothetical protein [Streptomyces sp. NPDC057301]|uniref:hypothetical protein n=1 Tax=Streptomyces sp. NPDC057301 TaxID=3346093 RepID=UPI0036443886